MKRLLVALFVLFVSVPAAAQQRGQRPVRAQGDYVYATASGDASCANIAKLKALAVDATPPFDDMLRAEAKRRLIERRTEFNTEVFGALMAAQNDGADLAQSTAKARGMVEAFRCYGEDMARGESKLIDDFERDETACRASAACMGQRAADKEAKAARAQADRRAKESADLVGAICGELADIQRERENIAEERANPSGVVDLRSLHESGLAIQSRTADLAASRALYLKSTGKPFVDATCSRTPATAAGH